MLGLGLRHTPTNYTIFGVGNFHLIQYSFQSWVSTLCCRSRHLYEISRHCNTAHNAGADPGYEKGGGLRAQTNNFFWQFKGLFKEFGAKRGGRAPPPNVMDSRCMTLNYFCVLTFPNSRLVFTVIIGLAQWRIQDLKKGVGARSFEGLLLGLLLQPMAMLIIII